MEENEITKFEVVSDPNQLDMFKSEDQGVVAQEEGSVVDNQQNEQPQPDPVQPDEPVVYDAVLGAVENNDNSQVKETDGQQGFQYTQEEIDSAVTQYLSSKLGREINSLDEINSYGQLDERVATIAKFVEETGKDPFDWFRYQAINPSEMDDFSVLKMDIMTKYPQLSQDEVDLMVSTKYKVDPDLSDEQTVKMAQLQLKMDAAQARESIETMRQSFKAPEVRQEAESVVDESWLQDMATKVRDLGGIEFDLGEGKSFKFGLDNEYKKNLIRKNAQIENFFDDYIEPDGSWDHERLASHRAIIDNIDNIISAIYKQGVGDGQKGLVDRAANIQASQPNVSGETSQSPNLAEQLSQYYTNGMKLTNY